MWSAFLLKLHRFAEFLASKDAIGTFRWPSSCIASVLLRPLHNFRHYHHRLEVFLNRNRSLSFLIHLFEELSSKRVGLWTWFRRFKLRTLSVVLWLFNFLYNWSLWLSFVLYLGCYCWSFLTSSVYFDDLFNLWLFGIFFFEIRFWNDNRPFNNRRSFFLSWVWGVELIWNFDWNGCSDLIKIFNFFWLLRSSVILN